VIAPLEFRGTASGIDFVAFQFRLTEELLLPGYAYCGDGAVAELPVPLVEGISAGGAIAVASPDAP